VRLLDLYCGAGGAGVGYARAGFEVIGVDLAAQPNYPYEFLRCDALEFLQLAGLRQTFDAIHASPPCQAYSRLRHARPDREWPDLLAPTRAALERCGLPWVIENVQGAPLKNGVVMLCGTAFGLDADGFEHRRHRFFEATFPMLVPGCQHQLPSAPLYGHSSGKDFRDRYGRGYGIEHKRAAMGIDWMNRDELAEAIPPAFTEYIGGALRDHLRAGGSR
jgi:DNA (cytosine-5)-methyltransferase 1